ncbi:hypothetical protein Ddye_017953 [Dipteronia dyeriana]|uniref:EF-hand domain-containing protein n=1 Tax=Dipteronia dyeriana TaxID=168575 RepID=A0AAD9UAH3_9ROSI|nr:hypothetical protein Ddye_017953 [Dipteronia dyeriana]
MGVVVGRPESPDESLRNCKAIFEQFDEDSNGAIDHEKLKKCFQKLEINFMEEEINDLFEACDINEDLGMKFNEFIGRMKTKGKFTGAHGSTFARQNRMVGKTSTGSFIWNSHMWGKCILDKGLRWRLGNGTSIRI